MDRETTERNLRYLVIEIFWAAIALGCYSFATAYLLRLGGTNLQVSLLTSAGALVNALMSIPFAIFIERRTNRWRWTVGSLWLMRSLYVGLILVPLLPGFQPESIVILLLVINVPLALFNVGWLPMFGEVVPLARRARLFSARNMTMNITVMITTFVMGFWLDLVRFPLNYQLMFALALVMSFLSTIYVARMVVPQAPPAPRFAAIRLSFSQLREQVRRQRPFVNITLNTLIFNIAFWMGTPLQPIYFVRDLNASDGWIGLWLGLISGGAIIGNLVWPRLIDRHGYAWVLLRATVLSAIYYFLIGLFPNLTLILLFALFFGAVSPGVDISHFSMLLDVCDPVRRTFFLSVFVAIMNGGFFLAALAAAPLLDLVDAQILLVSLGALRLIGALLFRFNPVHVASPQAS
ncbi:MAG TPA: MFS transporter [Roseiflexaceae bacterium]|nr:MFS transporter [Roseiflexaceae bacterium]HMP39894.1 MFS transporter [Roseiflexaceae bacterium]